MKALIGFGRCYIPSADDLSCSELKSLHTVSMCQLWAKSWKYTCLRVMDCLHYVTATCNVLKRLISQYFSEREIKETGQLYLLVTCGRFPSPV